MQNKMKVVYVREDLHERLRVLGFNTRSPIQRLVNSLLETGLDEMESEAEAEGKTQGKEK